MLEAANETLKVGGLNCLVFCR